MNPMLAGSPYAQYQQAQVETASPERLLLMLYEGAIRFSNAANKAMGERNYEQSHRNLVRVQDIITELMASLDMKVGGEIAANLFDIYEYLNRRLIEANATKSQEIVQEVVGMLKDLHGAWGQAAKNVAAERKTIA